jgi:hypothetical protein
MSNPTAWQIRAATDAGFDDLAACVANADRQPSGVLGRGRRP